MRDESNIGIGSLRRPSIGEAFGQARLALRLLRDGRVPAWHKLIPAIAIVYLVSPVDLLPEMIVGPLGIVDDLTILAIALRIFIQIAPEEVVADHTRESDSEPISTSYRVHKD